MAAVEATPVQEIPEAQPAAETKPAPVAVGAPQAVAVAAPAQQQMGAVLTVGFGDSPCTVTCQHCQAQVTTNVTHHVSCGTHLSCVACCFCCGIFGLLPYCINSCKAAKHFCPKCNQQIGYKKYITD
mmetsp:Transcript_14198/g.35869  ORF Transcript_14198/g.35869 Transcript_14198/m.35869 type:complete len:127 (+) Transcript_14198:89-469(+)